METRGEFGVGGSEEDFGIVAKFAGEVDDAEKEVADFFGNPGFISRSKFRFGFGEFFTDFFQNPGSVRPVESNLGGFLLELGSARESGEGLGNAVEEGLGAVAFFSPFDFVPLLENGGGIAHVAVTIDVGMSADEFLGNAVGDGVEVESISFGGDFAVEDHLEEEIAKFLAHVLGVIRLQGFERFVGLLNEIGAKGNVGLFLIPRASTGTAEVVNDLHQPREAIGVVGNAEGHD